MRLEQVSKKVEAPEWAVVPATQNELFIVVRQQNGSSRIPVDAKAAYSIGRAQDICDLGPDRDLKAVSRVHLSLVHTAPGKIAIVNYGTGTSVNGESLGKHEKQDLDVTKDVINIGTAQFRVSFEYESGSVWDPERTDAVEDLPSMLEQEEATDLQPSPSPSQRSRSDVRASSEECEPSLGDVGHVELTETNDAHADDDEYYEEVSDDEQEDGATEGQASQDQQRKGPSPSPTKKQNSAPKRKPIDFDKEMQEQGITPASTAPRITDLKLCKKDDSKVAPAALPSPSTSKRAPAATAPLLTKEERRAEDIRIIGTEYALHKSKCKQASSGAPRVPPVASNGQPVPVSRPSRASPLARTSSPQERGAKVSSARAGAGSHKNDSASGHAQNAPRIAPNIAQHKPARERGGPSGGSRGGARSAPRELRGAWDHCDPHRHPAPEEAYSPLTSRERSPTPDRFEISPQPRPLHSELTVSPRYSPPRRDRGRIRDRDRDLNRSRHLTPDHPPPHGTSAHRSHARHTKSSDGKPLRSRSRYQDVSPRPSPLRHPAVSPETMRYAADDSGPPVYNRTQPPLRVEYNCKQAPRAEQDERPRQRASAAAASYPRDRPSKAAVGCAEEHMQRTEGRAGQWDRDHEGGTGSGRGSHQRRLHRSHEAVNGSAQGATQPHRPPQFDFPPPPPIPNGRTLHEPSAGRNPSRSRYDDSLPSNPSPVSPPSQEQPPLAHRRPARFSPESSHRSFNHPTSHDAVPLPPPPVTRPPPPPVLPTKVRSSVARGRDIHRVPSRASPSSPRYPAPPHGVPQTRSPPDMHHRGNNSRSMLDSRGDQPRQQPVHSRATLQAPPQRGMQPDPVAPYHNLPAGFRKHRPGNGPTGMPGGLRGAPAAALFKGKRERDGPGGFNAWDHVQLVDAKETAKFHRLAGIRGGSASNVGLPRAAGPENSTFDHRFAATAGPSMDELQHASSRAFQVGQDQRRFGATGLGHR